MKQKRMTWMLLSLVLGGVLGAVAQGNSENLFVPLTAFGAWLRGLSESGTGGNLAAWGIVLTISALPLLGLLRKEKKYSALLLLTSAELLAMLYFLVNPTLLSKELYLGEAEFLANGWALVSVFAVMASVLGWLLLHLLSRIERRPARILPKLLLWTAIVYALFLGFTTAQELVAQFKEIAMGNSEALRVWKSGAVLTLLALFRMVPDLLAVGVLFWASDLAMALEASPFEEETILLAQTIAQRCKRVARRSILICIGGNLLQLLCFSSVAVINIRVDLPLLTLVLCAVLFLLCGYFRRAKEIHDDNASII